MNRTVFNLNLSRLHTSTPSPAPGRNGRATATGVAVAEVRVRYSGLSRRPQWVGYRPAGAEETRPSPWRRSHSSAARLTSARR